jgi:DNA-binding FrmR family transcriptional regulator
MDPSNGGKMNLPDELKEEIQQNILSRLRKIEGQVRGLQGMVSGGKECEQILTQLRAAQSALKSVGTLLVKSYLMKCYGELGSEPTPAEVFGKLEKTVAVLTRFIGG